MKLRFTANRVCVDHDPFVISLGDEAPDKSIRHSLQIWRDYDDEWPGDFHLELNDQINACHGTLVKRVELCDGLFRIDLRNGCGIRGGRYGDLSDDILDGIEVSFSVGADEYRTLLKALRQATEVGVPFHCDEYTSELLHAILLRWSGALRSDRVTAPSHIDALRKLLEALPEALRSRPDYETIRKGLPGLVDRRDPIQLTLLEFLSSQGSNLREEGRQILRDVEQILRTLPPT